MIDIIIPSYMSSAYHLTIALMTIQQQTIANKLHVIVVDDNNIEQYSNILNEVCTKFKNTLDIQIFKNISNSGPGFSRNVGIKNSKHSYLYFLDSDDYISNNNSLEELLNKAQSMDCDVVVGRVRNESHDGFAYSYNNIPDGYIDYDNASHQGLLYNRDFIINHNIYFPNSYYHEENGFTILLKYNNAKFYYINTLTYDRTWSNMNSLTSLPIKYDHYRALLELNVSIHDMLYYEQYTNDISQLQSLYDFLVRTLNCHFNTIRNCFVANFPLILFQFYYGKILFNFGKEHNLNLDRAWLGESEISAKLYAYYINDIDYIEYNSQMYSLQRIINEIIPQIEKEAATIKQNNIKITIECPWNQLDMFQKYIY